MVIQPALFIPLLTRKPIPLASKTAEARLPIGREFLTIGQNAARVGHHIAAAQVISQVELHFRSPIIRMRAPSPHDGYALLVVHHMHMVVRAGLRAAAPAMMLQGAID